MRDILIEQTVPFPREMVWQALTDPEQLGAWLMPNDFQPVVGRRFSFRTQPGPGFDGIVHCTVKALEPPARLVWTWQGGGIDTIVSFELRETGQGTNLRLRHSGFAGLSNILPRLVLGGGWKSLLRKKLPGLLTANHPAERKEA